MKQNSHLVDVNTCCQPLQETCASKSNCLIHFPKQVKVNIETNKSLNKYPKKYIGIILIDTVCKSVLNHMVQRKNVQTNHSSHVFNPQTSKLSLQVHVSNQLEKSRPLKDVRLEFSDKVWMSGLYPYITPFISIGYDPFILTISPKFH